MYLALHTRPDITYAVTKLSQFNTDPGLIHWKQAKHILRYLNKTKEHGLVYTTNESPKLQIYCDADWAGDIDDRHSYSGMVVKIGRNTVQWRSSKQKSISTSTMEAEYVSMSQGVKEAMWIHMLLDELQLSDFLISGSIEVYCDNRAAIDYSRNRVEKNKTKHIDISYHLIREKIEEGAVKILYIGTDENPADVLTKGLKKTAHIRSITNIGLDPAKVGDCGSLQRPI